MAIVYLRTELAQFSATALYAVCLRGLSNQEQEPLKSRMRCAAITTMFLFEIVWEGARDAYPSIFGLDEIDRRLQKIRERTNVRVDKLVLATVGLGVTLAPRTSAAVNQGRSKKKLKTRAESQCDEIKVSSRHPFADSRAQ